VLKKFVTQKYKKILFISILCLLAFKLFCFDAYRMDSDSMEPSLPQGSWVIVNKLGYAFGSQPKRSDVILFHAKDQDSDSSDSTLMIKRVIGISGDEVKFDNGHVFVNGMKTDGICFGVGRFLVPENKVFVLGDHCDTSKDSRDFGYVLLSGVVGEVILR
jgi:signal peptidase I